MAGKLVQVATETISSATASVDLIGTTTDDVYMVTANNIGVETNDRQWGLRVLKSSSADVTANYDFASKNLRTDTSFSNNGQTNQTLYSSTFLGTAGNETGNFICYLYNFNSSSEFSFFTFEETSRAFNTHLTGATGGCVHTVASASNGIQILGGQSSNLTSGTFTLYKVI